MNYVAHGRRQTHPQTQAEFGQFFTDFTQRGFAKVANLEQLVFVPHHQVTDGVDVFAFQAVRRPDRHILVASALSFLHERFNFKQRKDLLRAIFEKIYVQDRQIVDVKLNPPFSSLLKEDIDKLFKQIPSTPARKDIIEQIIGFIPLGRFVEVKELVNILVENAKPFLDTSKTT